MRFVDIITDVETIAKLTNQRALLKRAIQAGLDRYSGAYDFPHYRSRSFFTTDDDYDTGTVSVTNASKTVTGSGTTFTSSMVGRKFRVEGEKAWYDIDAFVSTTEITLKQAYQGDTDSALSFSIFQDEYRLDGEVDKPKIMRQIEDGIVLISLHYADIDTYEPTPDRLDDPLFEIMIGRQPDTYETGTVTAAANGTTITGSGTAWTTVSGLSRGSRLSITPNSEVYTVKSIDSDTQITVYELVSVGAAAGSAYKIILDNIRIQLYEVPDKAANIYYRYARIPTPLVNNYDEPDMPRQWHYMLVWAGLEVAFAQKGDLAKSQDAGARYNNWILSQIQAIGSLSPDRIYFKKSMDRLFPYPPVPRYPSQYGVNFPYYR